MAPHAKILALIKKNRKFLIATHMNPDLDAIASELALAEYLKACGKQVAIVHEKPVTKAFAFVRGVGSIQVISSFRGDYDVLFVVDCGDLTRTGKVQEILLPGKPIINIDHHRTNKPFATVNIVEPSASSTTEVIFSLFQRWNVRMTRTIADYLYLGILTDTGSFRYQNTTSRTHYVAAQLLGTGISPAQVYRCAYEDLEPKHLTMLTKIVQCACYYRDGRVVCLSLSKKILQGVEGEFDVKDKIFSLLRMLKNVEVIVVFSQEARKRTRVNFRSTGKVDVASIAQKFNGGGHRAASGCYVDRPIAQVQKIILSEVLKKVKGL